MLYRILREIRSATVQDFSANNPIHLAVRVHKGHNYQDTTTLATHSVPLCRPRPTYYYEGYYLYQCLPLNSSIVL